MDDKLKKYLDQKFKGVDQKFKGVDQKFNNLVETFVKEVLRLDKKIDTYREEVVEFKSGVYDKMDKVYKEVLDMRTEQTMHTGFHQRLDESLEDHEGRIQKLESPTATAHSIRRK